MDFYSALDIFKTKHKQSKITYAWEKKTDGIYFQVKVNGKMVFEEGNEKKMVEEKFINFVEPQF
jgi:hypothetical protein